MSENTYTIALGNALPGQPTVTLTLPDGLVRVFQRRKRVKGDDGVSRLEVVAPENWTGVTLPIELALDIERTGYSVTPSPSEQIRELAQQEKQTVSAPAPEKEAGSKPASESVTKSRHGRSPGPSLFKSTTGAASATEKE